MDNESLLQWMQVQRGSDTFNSGNGGSVFDFFHLYNTGTYQFAIHDYVAGTALAGAAADFCSGQMQLLAQHIGQERFLVNDQRPFDAVDNEYFFVHLFLPPFIVNTGDMPGKTVFKSSAEAAARVAARGAAQAETAMAKSGKVGAGQTLTG